MVSIATSNWPDEISNGVFIQWCLKLAEDDFHIPQWGGPNRSDGSFMFGAPNNDHFVIAPTGPRSWVLTKCVGMNSQEIAAVLATAAQRAGAQDTGQDLVYQVTVSSPVPDLGRPGFTLHMMRVLGDQRRITGSLRLADHVLLDFEEQASPETGPSLFPPTVDIKITTFVPGPAAADLANRTALAVFEIVSAICAFSLGRVVDTPFMVAFPLMHAEADVELSRRRDTTIRGLARDSVSLDIFRELVALGGPEALLRARNAFITLHEAQRQTNADVATMLYISAIEALITPGTQHDWRKDQVTRRFRDGVLSLCRDAVDAMLDHANVEEAFTFRKQGKIKWQRRQLVDRIYDLRSLPTHTGLSPSPRGGMMLMSSDHSMRVALLSDLTRAAILGYLQGPRTFLTGYPALLSAGSPTGTPT